jgi:hypothetical protein
MFVYGKKGRISPYSIKVLTQMQLSKLLVSKTKNIHSTSIKIISFLTFRDAAHE